MVIISQPLSFVKTIKNPSIYPLNKPFKKGNIYNTESTYPSAVQVGQDIAFGGGDYTAIACMSDIVAFGVIEGLKQCGIRVPYDMSVIGFDNLPDCEFMTPKLTSVAQDFEWKAKKAGDYLFKMIEEKLYY